MIKNFIRGLVVVVVLILSFAVCEKVLMLKSEDGIEQMQSFYLQKDNTVDVLLVGSSHIYCNVNTGILWDNYGISAFNLGGAEQPYWNSYYFIKEALKTQRPKAIVMSVTIPGIRTDDYQSENWLITNLYGMHWNKNRIDATKVSTLPDSFERLLLPINTIHNRYADLTKEDFIDSNKSISYKGYDIRSTVQPFDTPDVSRITEMMPLTDKQEEYYRKIIKLTKEENIPLLLVSVPFVVPDEAQKVYNYEFEIARQEGVDYIDFNKCYDEYGLDFQTDMAEELHLNVSGSDKFTRYLGQCLLDRYDIEDHRGDAKYASWDRDALIQRQEINDVKLASTDDFSEYLSLINTDNYITYFDYKNISEQDIPEEVREKLMAAGIETSAISDGYVSLVCGGNSLFASSDDSFSAVIDEGVDRLVLKRENKDDNIETNLYLNTTKLYNPSNQLCVIVYDRVLDRLAGFIVYDPYSNSITRYI